LKQMIIPPIDQRDVHRRPLERSGRTQTTKPTTDNDDSLPSKFSPHSSRLSYRRLFAAVPVTLHGSCRDSARHSLAPCFAIETGRESNVIRGTITTKDVLLNASTIVRGFGVAAYLRCLGVLLIGRRTTFLELVCPR